MGDGLTISIPSIHGTLVQLKVQRRLVISLMVHGMAFCLKQAVLDGGAIERGEGGG